MNLIGKIKSLLQKTLLYYCWRRCRAGWFQRFVLPRLKTSELHGVRLHLDQISLRMKEALVTGSYEAAEVRLCREVITSDDAVMEIGSAIGFLGLFACKTLGVKSYYSIEANPQTAELLLANYALNDLKPHVIVAALAEIDGQVELGITDDFWANSLCPTTTDHVRTVVQVTGRKLSTLLREAPFSPTVLIIDVEGGETCLQVETIPSCVKKLIIEIHPQLIGVSRAFEVLKYLMNQGFEVKGTFDNSYALVRVR